MSFLLGVAVGVILVKAWPLVVALIQRRLGL